MLLVSPAASKPKLDFKPPPHDHYHHPLFTPPPSARLTHKAIDPSSASSPSSQHRPLAAGGAAAAAAAVAGTMSAQAPPHRGLPPPSAMTLPDPSRAAEASRPLPHAMSAFQTGAQQMPAPPPQWQGAEESMRNWLATRAEEERRRQEEEKTRQENLRLEQRRIEQSMLRDSMQAGVPPHLIPVIFAGISGTSGFEALQSYYANIQATGPQLAQQASPEARRDGRLLSHPHAGAHAQPPRTSGQASLPRLTTNEMHIVPPPTTHHNVHPPQSTPNLPQESQPSAQHQHQHHPPPPQQQSSPSIYFHHWVPPSSQGASTGGSGNPPPTPSDQSSISPKKRKAQGSHQAPPHPSSSGHQASPSYSSSTTSTPRRGHGRARSDLESASQPTSHPGSGNLGSTAASTPGDMQSKASRRHSSVDVTAAMTSPASVKVELGAQRPRPATPERPHDGNAQRDSVRRASITAGRSNDGRPVAAQPETTQPTPNSPKRPPTASTG